MSEPRRCAFCEELIQSGRYCDDSCRTLDQDDDEGEPGLDVYEDFDGTLKIESLTF